ncbi:alanine racemase [Candidatus Dependentiae bacterium]|nr:alanine racemase [Candidatus Dependentiae bacterium]
MDRQSFIELNRSAFNHNIDHIKNAANGSQVALVLKANAYGHGLKELAAFAQSNQTVSWICTATLTEAFLVRNLVPEKPILVLSHSDSCLEKAISLSIHLTVYTIEDAYAISRAAQKTGRTASIHIKIDTGMGRLGFTPDEAPSFIQKVRLLPSIAVYGIYTHLCDTPNADQSFSYLQLQRFDDLLVSLESMGISIPCTHALSSSGLVIKPSRTYTFLRCGAFAYGNWKSESHRKLLLRDHPQLHLEPILRWKTPVIALKTIKKGDSVGYDRTFIAQRQTLLALTPIGYADGYPRALSNKKDVAVYNNHLLSVAGLVSMNITAFDVTHVPTIKLYDTITVLGGTENSSIYRCAQIAHTISNELSVHINSQFRRVITEEQPLTEKATPPMRESSYQL